MASSFERLAPELLHQILSDIGIQELGTLVRTNHRLHSLALPYLYAKVSIPAAHVRSPYIPWSKISLQSVFAGAIAHASQIRNLGISTAQLAFYRGEGYIWDDILKVLKAIQAGQLYALCWPDNGDPIVRTVEVSSLIASLRHLAILELGLLRATDEPLYLAEFSLKALSVSLEAAARLRGPSLNKATSEKDVELVPSIARALLSRSQKTLVGLVLTFPRRFPRRVGLEPMPGENQWCGSIDDLLDDMEFPCLERLCLRNSVFTSESKFCDVINFSNMVELRLPECQDLAFFARALDRREIKMPALKKLTLSGNEDELATFLRGLPGIPITELIIVMTITNATELLSDLYYTILNIGSSLELLSFERRSRLSNAFTPEQVEGILSAHPKLHTLNISVRWNDYPKYFAALSGSQHLRSIHLYAGGSDELQGSRVHHALRDFVHLADEPGSERRALYGFDLIARAFLLDLVETVMMSHVVRAPLDRDFDIAKDSALRIVGLTSDPIPGLNNVTAVYEIESERRRPTWMMNRGVNPICCPEDLAKHAKVYVGGWSLGLNKLEDMSDRKNSRSWTQQDPTEGTVLFGY